MKIKFLIFLIYSSFFFLFPHHLHSWGDDFALYIYQSEHLNFLDFKSIDPLFVFNSKIPEYSPPFYPIVFPLFLKTVSFLFGNSILSFKLSISFLLVLSAFLFFSILQKFALPTLWAFFGGLLLIAHPFIFSFSNQVLSDVLLLFWVLLAWFIYTLEFKAEKTQALLIGMISALAFQTKSIGLVLFLTFLFFFFFPKKSSFLVLINLCFSFVVALFLPFLFSPQSSGHHFFTLFFSGNFLSILMDNILVFKNELLSFINTLGFDQLSFFSKYLSFVFFFFVALGLYLKRKTLIAFPFVFLIFFLGTLALFPNYNQGFRYFIPIVPLLFFFFLFGVYLSFDSKFINTIFAVLLICFLFLYVDKDRLISIAEETKSPYSESSRNMFDFIQKNTSTNDLLIFSKPRALAYFTKRQAILVSDQFLLDDQIPKSYKGQKLYFLSCVDLKNQLNEEFFKSNHHQLQMIKQTGFYTLYAVESLQHQSNQIP